MDEKESGLTYSEKYYEQITASCAEEDLDSCTSVTIHYPELYQLPDSSGVSYIKKHMDRFLLTDPFDQDSTLETLNALSTAFFEEYETLRDESNGEIPPWSLNRSVNVEWLTNKILTLSFQETSYTGGAHPNTVVFYQSFNLESQTKVQLNDILKDNYRAELQKIGEEVFRENNDLPISTSLNEAGFWFKDNNFELNNNFALMRSGIKFYYNAYEIAPYSRGATEITIPYDTLNPLMKPSFSYLGR